MKKESGLGVVGIILLICFVIAVIGGIYFLIKQQSDNQKENDIKSNMLLIQGACKVLYEDCVMNKTTDKLIGIKLSDVDMVENINKNIIGKFKETNIIPESDYSKYYILTDEHLNELKLDVKNEEDSYYLINYEKEDVIITCGYNGKYKLSDIEKEDEVIEEETNPEAKPDEEIEPVEENSGE